MKRERVLLILLAAVNFTHIMDFMIMMPLGPQLMRIFEISPKQFGMLVSAYTFSAGISGFLGAFWVDRFDRKKVLIAAYLGFLAGTLACATAPSYGLLMIARTVTGAFGGILGATVLSIVGDLIPEQRRGAAMGIVMAAFSVASVFGVPFGLYLANLMTWHAPFYFLACYGTLMLPLLATFIPPVRSHLDVAADIQHKPLAIFSHVVKDNSMMFALSLAVLLVMGQFTVIPFISPYMVANVGFSEKQLAYIYLIGGGLTVFTSPMIGKWSDRMGKGRVFAIFAILTTVPLFLITNMSKVAIPVALVVTTLFFVTSSGRWIPAMAMVTSTVTPQQRGRFMSLNASVQQLAAGAAASFSGNIISRTASGQLIHYPTVGYFAIVATLGAVLVAKKLKMVE